MAGQDLTPSSHRAEKVREVLKKWVGRGWTLRPGGHWGLLYCPCDANCTVIAVSGTPRNPEQHARNIDNTASGCPVGPDFSELHFTGFLAKLLAKTGHKNVKLDAPLGREARADIIAESREQILIVEVKRVSPQTNMRLEDAVAQIKHYGDLAQNGAYRGRKQRLILATPGALASNSSRMLRDSGIEIWDGTWIAQRAAEANLLEEAAEFFAPEYFERAPQSESRSLADRLTSMASGRASWSAYQRLCRDIAEYLFCPPLRSPIWESLDGAEVNKRDFILPNYAEDGFWKFLRDKYCADFVVVDAKNYTEGIKKQEVLQIANYLTKNGTGLFALIMTRVDPAESAVLTIRDHWVTQDKMIVVLTDGDILQMLTDKSFGHDPSEVLRQKIEDFRLKI
ncbi:hypothetical protein [Streptomyces albogriseolus]|uniref:hypothetical protein n=1 Tax=Streptomyces albogriseolus TaxID=1887 RepID=UPI0034603CB5